ncbi:circularly permuted type 2 ATP-grasp protein [Cupriavidus pinatubonensis]|uniref:circularly permuted type 2 ATP-grasp protein n=1 Tax=Cupriavidus pinatubonensis TaxID=248026 RepID=UPI003618A331
MQHRGCAGTGQPPTGDPILAQPLSRPTDDLDATRAAAAIAAAARLAQPVPAGHLDELRLPDGSLREAWARFFTVVGEPNAETLGPRATAMARQIRDNGVTYNVYADQGAARAWPLELFPFLVTEQDWQLIERGAAQRATLANAILADIYGEQTLLSRALLPPGLVYGHPGYLHPLRGYQPPGGSFLQIVAVDLVHTDDGWTVMAHRTDTPSGMGYALENRLIISSLFTDAFRDLHVRRLPPAFAQLVSTLAHAPLAAATEAGSGRDGPVSAGTGHHIVLLTPGPYNETFFEHTFLARYLGITLVEGKDLTVRNDVVYLKTFGGLERVDVVLRRLDDVFCDPLELRHDSTLGIPGLLEAMRAGNVMVSNVPGAGFLESPAMHGFLPGIAEALLGEPLILPGVPSWWCGEDAAREQALSTLTEAFVMPTYPRRADLSEEPPLGMELGLQALDGWRERIARMPDRYTLQPPLPLSHTPCWEGNQIGSRAAMLRVFAVADGNGGWQVMAGGFSRLAAPQLESVSMQLGGTSADTWVLSGQPVPAAPLTGRTGLAPPTPARPLAVSSRAAENLFWAGRYAERAENNVRLCRQILGSIESSDDTDDGTLSMQGQLAERDGLVPAEAPSPKTSLRLFERSLVATLADARGGTGLVQNLAAHAAAASEIRNRLSNDHWRTILAARNDFGDAMMEATLAPSEASVSYDRARVLSALEHLAMQLGAINGAQGDRMSRDEAWRLVFIGRHIERLATMSNFLLTAIDTGALRSRSGFELLLHLFDCTLTYRSLYPGRTDLAALVELLVLEPTNPRGLYGLLERLRNKLEQLAPGGSAQTRVPLAELLPAPSALPTRAALCEPLGEAGGDPAALSALCQLFIERMGRVSDEISARYFSHAGANPEAES